MKRGSKSLTITLSSIFILSVLFTFFAISQLHKSGQYIGREVSRFSTLGKTASVEECVDAVLSWANTCSAIRDLCQSSVGKMMSACLVSQNRADYCKSVGTEVNDSHFGYKHCYERGLSKRNKACAEAYSTIGGYCLYLRAYPRT